MKVVSRSRSIWSGIWLAIGILALIGGVSRSLIDLVFLTTSRPAIVKVEDVTRVKQDGRITTRYTLSAENDEGQRVSSKAPVTTGRALHVKGEITAGRFSARTGEIKTDALDHAKRVGVRLWLVVGMYLTRRLWLSPLGYLFGFLTGRIHRLIR